MNNRAKQIESNEPDLIFDSLEAFKLYLLEATENGEENHLASQKNLVIQINHKKEDPIPERELQDVVKSLLKQAYPWHLHLASHNGSKATENYNQLFLNVYLRNKRRHHQAVLQQAGQLPEQIQPSGVTEVKPVNWEKVSRAKINLAKGERANLGGLQLQRQQKRQQQNQKQQQQQQQQSTQQLMNRRREQLAKRKKIQPQTIQETINESALGILIDRNNIEETVRAQAERLYPNLSLNLKGLWNNLVGEHEKEIAAQQLAAQQLLDRAVTHVTQEAMDVILKHYSEFKYGLVLDNLPAGFYLQRTHDKLILSYQDAMKSQPILTPQWLTISLPEKRDSLFQGDGRQFYLEPMTSENLMLAPTANEILLAKQFQSDETSFEERRTLLVSLMTKDHPEWMENINALLTSLELNTEQAIKGLTSVMLVGGPETVLHFLNKLSLLKQDNLYDVFKKVFLEEREDYSDYVSVEGFARLDALLSWDITKRIWWEALIQQHHKEVGYANFGELFVAFDYFAAEMIRLTNVNTLPIVFPFTNIKHMKVGLDRLLLILDRAVDKQEQLENLAELDLSAEGAYYASKFDDYKLVTKEMRLSLINKIELNNEIDIAFIVDSTYEPKMGGGIQRLYTPNFMMSYREAESNLRNPSGNQLIILSHIMLNNIEHSFAGQLKQIGIKDSLKKRVKIAEKSLREKTLVADKFKDIQLGKHVGHYVINEVEIYYLPSSDNVKKLELLEKRNASHLFGYGSLSGATSVLSLLTSQASYSESEEYFFRYIGQQEMALSANVYRDIARKVAQIEFADNNKSSIKMEVEKLSSLPNFMDEEVQATPNFYHIAKAIKIQAHQLDDEKLGSVLLVMDHLSRVIPDKYSEFDGISLNILDMGQELYLYLQGFIEINHGVYSHREQDITLKNCKIKYLSFSEDFRKKFLSYWRLVIRESLKSSELKAKSTNIGMKSLSEALRDFLVMLNKWDLLAERIHSSIQQDPLRCAFLPLVGLCCANERQLMVGDKIEAQFDAFLQLICEDMKKGVIAMDSMAYYLQAMKRMSVLISQMDVQYRPSLQDMLFILRMWIRSNSSSSNNRSPYFFDALFPYVNTMKNAFYDILKCQEERSVTPHLAPFNLLTFMQRVGELNLDSADPVSRKIFLLLSLLDEIDHMSVQEMHSTIYPLFALSPALRNAFLEAIVGIQINKSTSLPSKEAVLAAVHSIAQAEITTPSHKEELEQAIAAHLQRLWPEVYIVEEKPVATVMLGMVKILAEEMEHSGLVAALQDMKSNPFVQENMLIKKAASLIDQPLLLLTDFLATTRRATNNDFPNVVISLKTLENGLADFLNNFFVSTAINLVLKINDSSVEGDSNFLNAYLKEKKLAILFDQALREQFQTMVKDKLNEMRISHESTLLTYLLNLSEGLSTSMPIDEFLSAYSLNVAKVSDFLNSLVIVNNTHHAAFRKVYRIIETEKELVPLEDHSKLLKLCSQGHRIAIDQKISLIYRLIGSSANNLSFINPSEKDKVRIKQAYRQLKLLMNYEDVFPTEHFMKLLQLSFQHNLQHDVPFPFEFLAKLSSLGSAGDMVFKQLIETISQTTPDAEIAMLDAIKLTVQLMQSEKNSAPMVTFIKDLLIFYQEGSVDSWANYRACLEKLPSDPHQLENMVRIVSGVIKNVSSNEQLSKETINQLIDRLLPLPEEQLQILGQLFHYSPTPSLDWINRILNDRNRNVDFLREKINEFDLDPFGLRIIDEIKIQFSIGRVKSVVSEIKRLPDNESLSEEEQIKLCKQFVYINAIGNDMPVNVVGTQIKKALTQFGRIELENLGKDLLEKLEIESDPLAKEKLYLTLLAVMRETFYRTNGKFANSTQMLSALMMVNFPGNILLQLNTGEGKSILEPLALMLERSKGIAVNDCTSNADLVARDHKSTSSFFEFFGVESRLINQDSPMYSYAKSGINYATLGEASLYRANAKLFGEQLREKDAGFASLFINESDADIINNRTTLNLASGGSHNPYEWIYPLINAFVDQVDYQNIDPLKGAVWESYQDVLHLKKFLLDTIAHPQHKEQFKLVSDHQWKKWLEAATTAKQHREGTEFIIHSKMAIEDGVEKEIFLAVPLDKNIPQEGSTRENGVQQFIHARLQLEKSAAEPSKRFYFPIEDESLQTASETVKNFIKRHLRKGGRLIGISATLGSLVELAEQESNYQVQAFSIPPHLPSQRKDLPLIMKPLGIAHVNAVMKELRGLYRVSKKPKSLQPNLIICKDMDEARALYEKLQRDLKLPEMTFQCVLGTESAAEREAMVKKAGLTNMITISTSLLGRGTDIPVTDKRGLSVIQTYLDNESGARQIMGRAARNGKVGRYVAILGQAGNVLRYGIDLMKVKASKREKKLQIIYQQMSEEMAVERHYTQEMDTVQNIALDHFQRWHKFILHLNADNPKLPTIERSLLEKREALIQDIKDKWQVLLDESDVEKRYTANVYIRRNGEGRLDSVALDHCIIQLEMAVKERWHLELKALEETYFTKDQQQIPRYVALDKRDIQIELDDRKIKAPEKKKKLTFEQTHLNLDTVLMDKEGACLTFEDGLSGDDREYYAKQSALNQLLGALPQLAERIKKSAMKTADKKALKVIFSQLESVLRENNTVNLGKAMDISCELIDTYHRSCRNQTEKFEAQAFLGTVINVSELMHSEKIDVLSDRTREKLATLKNTYFEHAYDQLTGELHRVLKWRSDGKWYHQIDRSIAKVAADNILGCLQENSKNSDNNQEKFSRLYQVLLSEQFILKDKFLFGVFHENIKKTINRTLSSITYLSVHEKMLGFSLSQLQEKTKVNLIIKKYSAKLDSYLAKAKAPLNDIKDIWNRIKQSPGLFNFDELLSAVSLKKATSASENLKNEIQHIKKSMCQELPLIANQLSFSHFIKKKQSQWKNMAGLFTIPCEKITFSFKHEGFRQYGEVTIHVAKGQSHAGLQWAALGLKKLASRNGDVYVKRFHDPHELFAFEIELKQLLPDKVPKKNNSPNADPR